MIRILSFFLFLSTAFASTIRVMSFNTMCDICKNKKDYSKFKVRLHEIANTISRYQPDLISLQEFRNKRQIKKLNALLGNKYEILSTKSFIFHFTDTSLLVKKNRFTILSQHSYWLGPNNGKFTFGWKFGIARQLVWAYLRDLETNQDFIFAGSHFDNHGVNKKTSSALLNKIFENLKTPIIFAADTNLNIRSDGYINLIQNFFDTFNIAQEIVINSNHPYKNSDACRKTSFYFPDCRIDHILISKNSPWNSLKWSIDLFRYGKKFNFASDHRAIFSELSY